MARKKDAKEKNREDIAKAILLTWDSLDSHLYGAMTDPNNPRVVGNRKFHADCCRDYAQVILTLCNQL